MRGLLVLVPLSLAALALPAAADPPTVAGVPCRGLTAAADPISNPGTRAVAFAAGPIVAADLPADFDPLFWDIFGNPARVTLRCTIQVNGTGSYDDPDLISVTAPPGAVIVAIPPMVISFQANLTDAIWFCTIVTAEDAHGDTTTVYWDETSHSYTTNAAAARCAPTTLGATLG